jgi:hypothetical protein
MKKFYYFSAVVTMAVTMLCGTSCQEEEVKVSNEDLTNGRISEVINNDSVLTIDGKRMEWNINITPQKKSISKGVIQDERSYYTTFLNEKCKNTYGEDYELFKTIKCTYKGVKYSFEVLRIDRKSEPGKYFYVMLDNLKVKMDTACWAYADDESYVEKYGRLYTWDAANALAKKIRMNLPSYSEENPKKEITPPLPVKARLLSIKDVLDIIECDAIGSNSENGYSIEDNYDAPKHILSDNIKAPFFYYDAFIGGLDGPEPDNTFEYDKGEHVLAGWRCPYEQNKEYWFLYIKGRYTDLNKTGSFWLKDFYADETSHFFLDIQHSQENNYVSYIKGVMVNETAISVRYVFEPEYIK